jgi:hypothetical protein
MSQRRHSRNRELHRTNTRLRDHQSLPAPGQLSNSVPRCQQVDRLRDDASLQQVPAPCQQSSLRLFDPTWRCVQIALSQIHSYEPQRKKHVIRRTCVACAALHHAPASSASTCPLCDAAFVPVAHHCRCLHPQTSSALAELSGHQHRTMEVLAGKRVGKTPAASTLRLFEGSLQASMQAALT